MLTLAYLPDLESATTSIEPICRRIRDIVTMKVACFFLSSIFLFILRADQGYSQDRIVRYAMATGWNLVSLPVRINDARVDRIFPTAVSEAYAYDSYYAESESLRTGIGYWVKFAAPETVTIEGNSFTVDTIVLQKGWNLIGSTSFTRPISTIKTDPPGILSSDYYYYSQGGVYTTSSVLECGKGYWIKAEEAGLLIRDSLVIAKPVARIRSYPRDSIFILEHFTQTWSGVPFTFYGLDPNSRTIEYSWRVDSMYWSPWSYANHAELTAADLDSSRSYTGQHTFEVRARNEFGAINVPDSASRVSFMTVYPEFVSPEYIPRLLFVHYTMGDTADLPYSPSTETVTDYYLGIFDSIGIPYDVWITAEKGNPTLSALGSHGIAYIVSDILPFDSSTSPMVINGTRYTTYCSVGGNILMNGLPHLIIPQVMTNPDSLLVKTMHFFSWQYPLWVYNRSYDFIGAFGHMGYPAHIELDTAKLDPLWNGKLADIPINWSDEFSKTIFTFDSYTDSASFEGYQIGCRYDGPTYKTIFLGIPLYFVKKEQAEMILRESLNYLSN